MIGLSIALLSTFYSEPVGIMIMVVLLLVWTVANVYGYGKKAVLCLGWMLLTIAVMCLGTFLGLIIFKILSPIMEDWFTWSCTCYIVIHGSLPYFLKKGNMEYLLLLMLIWLTIGMTLSLFQWIMLRRTAIKFIAWFKLSSLSYIMPFLVMYLYSAGYILFSRGPKAIISVHSEYWMRNIAGVNFIFFAALASVGFYQWLAIRKAFRKSWWWIIAVSASFFFWFMLYLRSGECGNYLAPLFNHRYFPYVGHSVISLFSGTALLEMLSTYSWFKPFYQHWFQNRWLFKMDCGFIFGLILGIGSGICFTVLPKKEPSAP